MRLEYVVGRHSDVNGLPGMFGETILMTCKKYCLMFEFSGGYDYDFNVFKGIPVGLWP